MGPSLTVCKEQKLKGQNLFLNRINKFLSTFEILSFAI